MREDAANFVYWAFLSVDLLSFSQSLEWLEDKSVGSKGYCGLFDQFWNVDIVYNLLYTGEAFLSAVPLFELQ